MGGRRSKIRQLHLWIVGLFSLGLGLLKIYTHYYSIWRSGALDYIVAVGAVVGGLFLFAPKGSKAVMAVNCFFIFFEAYKLIIDFRDLHDVLLCGTAIVCLFIPIVRR